LTNELDFMVKLFIHRNCEQSCG